MLFFLRRLTSLYNSILFLRALSITSIFTTIVLIRNLLTGLFQVAVFAQQIFEISFRFRSDIASCWRINRYVRPTVVVIDMNYKCINQ